MEWLKWGRLFGSDSVQVPWFKSRAMRPLPTLMPDGRIRVFVTMCDAAGHGRVGYVDLDLDSPTRIVGYSREPVVDLGPIESFKGRGVLTSSLVASPDEVLLYYSAYGPGTVTAPYTVLAGVAAAPDINGTFTDLSRDPLLPLTLAEPSIRSSPTVIRVGESLRVIYSADSERGWLAGNRGLVPSYELRSLNASSTTRWDSSTSSLCIPLADDDEFGITAPTLWMDERGLRMIFSVRTHSRGYRLGYAESADGETFQRMDLKLGLSVSEHGWDSEMIAFAQVFKVDGSLFVAYCGNDYGNAGVGLAQLKEDS